MVPSWSIVAVDLHSVVQKLCNSDPTSVNLVQADFVKVRSTRLLFPKIALELTISPSSILFRGYQRIQVCSNILLRDIVSTTEAVESVEVREMYFLRSIAAPPSW